MSEVTGVDRHEDHIPDLTRPTYEQQIDEHVIRELARSLINDNPDVSGTKVSEIVFEGERCVALIYASDQQFFKANQDEPIGWSYGYKTTYQNGILMVADRLELRKPKNKYDDRAAVVLTGTSAHWTVDLPTRRSSQYAPVMLYPVIDPDSTQPNPSRREFDPVFELVPYQEAPYVLSGYVVEQLEEIANEIVRDEDANAQNEPYRSFSLSMEMRLPYVAEGLSNNLDRLNMAFRISRRDGQPIEYQHCEWDEESVLGFEVDERQTDEYFVTHIRGISFDQYSDSQGWREHAGLLLESGRTRFILTPKELSDYNIQLVWRNELEGDFAEPLDDEFDTTPAESIL